MQFFAACAPPGAHAQSEYGPPNAPLGPRICSADQTIVVHTRASGGNWDLVTVVSQQRWLLPSSGGIDQDLRELAQVYVAARDDAGDLAAARPA